ncbi:MFS transporter [Brevibacterium sediminis]|uniref:MFS transporter n=1 Tax=Brevibacterium sediminis TaxID=1857024 RepID=A0ABQ1LX59_9MICO|nr:MFS transporter [Brevibacterium sediminis]GGC31492.1 MFS transporter [Brevibacterium sediminis]
MRTPAEPRSTAHSASTDRLPTLVLAAAVFVFLVAEMLPTGLMPEIATDFGVPPTEVGGLIGWYALIAGVSGLPFTAATRRLPRRSVLVGALAVLALAQTVVAIAPDLIVVIIARAFIASTHVTLWSIAPLIAAELAPADRQSRSAGRVFLGSSAAMLAGVPGVTLFGQTFGWRASSLAIATVAAIVAFAALAAIPSLPPRSDSHSAKDRSASARTFVFVTAPTLLLVTGIYVLYPYLSQYAAADRIVGGGYSVFLVAFGTIGVVGVWLASSFLDARPRLVSSAVVVFAGLLPLGVSIHQSVSVPAIILWGLPVAAAPAILQSTVVRLGGVGASVLSATYVVGFQVGIVSGTWIGGLALGVDGAAPLWCLGFAALALPFVLASTRSKRTVRGSALR